MPLTNFGAILNFAETIEAEGMDFYLQASQQAGAGSLSDGFAALATEGKKLRSLVQRTRRENVTEMILEPIRDFYRASYQLSVDDPTAMDRGGILNAAVALENRAFQYYNDAADRIRALPEVSRALKMLAKKHAKRIDRFNGMIA